MTFWERLSALGWFLLAAAWFLCADVIAMRAAAGLSFGDFYEPLHRLFLLFLLILGYSLMSRLALRRGRPGRNIGLDARSTWKGEFALGAALGWGGAVACVLPVAVVGGMVITIFGNRHQLWVAVLDLAALLAGTLAIELAFRGFAYRKLVDAMGPVMGTFFMAVVYAIWRTHAAPTSTAAVLASFLLGCVLALAALRTAAVWVSWGFHFAWAAVMSLIFGLPMAGGLNFSPVLVTNAVGPGWITGNAQGPEGSAFGVVVALALLFIVVRATGDLKHKYGYPEIVPAGIPVDLDAAARQQHEAAMAHAEPAAPGLVQIAPAASAAAVTPIGEAAAPSAPPVDEAALRNTPGDGSTSEDVREGEEEIQEFPSTADKEEPPGPEAS